VSGAPFATLSAPSKLLDLPLVSTLERHQPGLFGRRYGCFLCLLLMVSFVVDFVE